MARLGRLANPHDPQQHPAKLKNFAHEPRVALSIADPEDPNRYVEVRGVVESVGPDDAEASFYGSLQVRYDDVYEITDAPERVVVTIRPESYVIVVGGSVLPSA